MKKIHLLLLAAAVFILPAVADATTFSVSVTDSGGFSPGSVSIQEGDTVTWTNNTSVESHSVYSNSHPSHLIYAPLNLGSIGTLGGTVSLVFGHGTAGTYGYHDHFNASLTGTVVVAAPPDSTAPAAISNLAASSPTTTSIKLTWVAPGDDSSTGTATSYDIRYATSSITEGTFTSSSQVASPPSPAIAGTTQEVTVSGLTSNTTYFFAMKTSDEVPNTSVISNVASLATSSSADSTAPTAIANLAASTPTTTSIKLTWVAPGDDGASGTATSYDIRYATSSITEGTFTSSSQVAAPPSPTASGTAQEVTVNGLTSSTTYFFAMKTSDEVPNRSGISNVATLATSSGSSGGSDTTSPAAVTNLAASNATTNSIKLTWTAPGDDGSVGTASSYDIRYATHEIVEGIFSSSTNVTSPPTPAAAGTAQEITVTGLTAGTKYYFALKARDEVPNTSTLSNVVNLTTTSQAAGGGTATTTTNSGDTTSPAAIINLAASNATANSAKLTWTAPGDDGASGSAASYDIRHSTSPITAENFNVASQFTSPPAPEAAGGAQEFVATELTAGIKYYFAIKTLDEAPNTSAISNVVNLTTSAIVTGGGESEVQNTENTDRGTDTNDEAPTLAEELADATSFTDDKGDVLEWDDVSMEVITPPSISFLDKMTTTIDMVTAFDLNLWNGTELLNNSTIYFDKPMTIKIPVTAGKCAAMCFVYQYYAKDNYKYITAGEVQDTNILSFKLTHMSKYFVTNGLIEKKDFVDLVPGLGHWAYGIVKELHNKDILNGYKNGTVRVDAGIKRSEAVKLLSEMFRINPVSKVKMTFKDLLEPAAWYMPYLGMAFEKGILTGYEDGTIKPGSDINRAEALAIFIRTLQITNLDSYKNRPNEFADVETAAWYYPYLAFAYEKGIVEGFVETLSDGSVKRFFMPGQAITRGSFSKLLIEFVKLQSA